MDAVCINQHDIEERGQQVGMMNKVYSQARSVPIWLGRADKTTMAALRSIDLLVAQCRAIAPTEHEQHATFFVANRPTSNPDQELPRTCHWTAIMQFYSATWFSRLWVVQEVMLNENALFFYGPFSRTRQDIFLAAQWLYYAQYHSGNYSAERVEGIHTMAALWRLHHQGSVDFTNILSISRRMKTSLSLDKIYGVLGLLESRALPTMASEITTPDYTRGLATVYAAATRAAMVQRNGEDDTLNVLQRAQVLVSATSTKADDSDWPSWVPRFDWIVDNTKGSPSSITASVQGAANGRPAHVANFSDCLESDMILHLTGVTIDKVTAMARVFDVSKLGERKNANEFASVFLQCIEVVMNTRRSVENLHLLFTGRCDKYGADAGQSDEHLHNYEAFVECCQENPGSMWERGGRSCAYKETIWYKNSNRRVFVTENGFAGCGPAEMEVGDEICILFGGKRPFVLRQEGEYYRFLGEAYVHMHGVMEGEYIRKLEAEGRLETETREFAIH